MDVSLLIATYRRDDTLRPCLDSLAELDGSGMTWELVLVDNAGQESTRELAHSYRGKIDLHYVVETTPGKNSALNRALGLARGKLYVFTDDDIIAPVDWLQEMWAGACRWPEHALFGGRILPRWPDRPHKLPISVVDPAIQAAFGILDPDRDEGEIAADEIWGGNMAIRAAMFAGGVRFNPAVGPKGANYIMGSESELLTKLGKAGARAIYLPRSKVLHQIRLDQLTVEWLRGRAFRDGRHWAYLMTHYPSAPRYICIPRFLRIHLYEATICRLRQLRRRDPAEALRLEMSYWRLRGYLHQFYVQAGGSPGRGPDG